MELPAENLIGIEGQGFRYILDSMNSERLVVAAHCFPTGFLGYWVRRLAESGLAAALTATSPPRPASPEGVPAFAGTNPLAIAVPSTARRPPAAHVPMGKVPYGDLRRGHAAERRECKVRIGCSS